MDHPFAHLEMTHTRRSILGCLLVSNFGGMAINAVYFCGFISFLLKFSQKLSFLGLWGDGGGDLARILKVGDGLYHIIECFLLQALARLSLFSTYLRSLCIITFAFYC